MVTSSWKNLGEVMDRLWLALALLMPCVLGLLRLIGDLRSVSDKQTFAVEFLEKLRAYFESGGENGEAYGWLIHRSNRMQNQLGSGGILAAFRPAFANYQYTELSSASQYAP